MSAFGAAFKKGDPSMMQQSSVMARTTSRPSLIVALQACPLQRK
jgi:hypothetical protein